MPGRAMPGCSHAWWIKVHYSQQEEHSPGCFSEWPFDRCWTECTSGTSSARLAQGSLLASLNRLALWNALTHRFARQKKLDSYSFEADVHTRSTLAQRRHSTDRLLSKKHYEWWLLWSLQSSVPTHHMLKSSSVPVTWIEWWISVRPGITGSLNPKSCHGQGGGRISSWACRRGRT